MTDPLRDEPDDSRLGEVVHQRLDVATVTETKRCTGCGNTWTAPVTECDCGQGTVVFDGAVTIESLRPAIEAAPPETQRTPHQPGRLDYAQPPAQGAGLGAMLLRDGQGRVLWCSRCEATVSEDDRTCVNHHRGYHYRVGS